MLDVRAKRGPSQYRRRQPLPAPPEPSFTVHARLRHMRTPAFIVLALLLPACSRSHSPPPGSITHVVICYLKQPADPAARQKLIDASKEFRAIPGVLEVQVGKVLPSTRPIVVSDYDVGLVITYKDADAMK